MDALKRIDLRWAARVELVEDLEVTGVRGRGYGLEDTDTVLL